MAKRIFAFLVFLFSASAGAQTNSIFIDGGECAAEIIRGPELASLEDEASFYELIQLAAQFPSGIMSCDTARGIKSTVTAVKAILQPISVAVLHPEAQKILKRDAAKAKNLLRNPIVLTIAMITVTGITAYHQIVLVTIDDCNRQDVQRMIEDEVKRRTGYKPNQILVDPTGKAKP